MNQVATETFKARLKTNQSKSQLSNDPSHQGMINIPDTQLIISFGPPNSNKTKTLEQAFPSAAVISYFQTKEELSRFHSNSSLSKNNSNHINEICLFNIINLLNMNKQVVYDNNTLKTKTLKKVLKYAKEHNIKIQIILFNFSKNQCDEILETKHPNKPINLSLKKHIQTFHNNYEYFCKDYLQQLLEQIGFTSNEVPVTYIVPHNNSSKYSSHNDSTR